MGGGGREGEKMGGEGETHKLPFLLTGAYSCRPSSDQGRPSVSEEH